MELQVHVCLNPSHKARCILISGHRPRSRPWDSQPVEGPKHIFRFVVCLVCTWWLCEMVPRASLYDSRCNLPLVRGPADYFGGWPASLIFGCVGLSPEINSVNHQIVR
jgi:hypothetical protein